MKFTAITTTLALVSAVLAAPPRHGAAVATGARLHAAPAGVAQQTGASSADYRHGDRFAKRQGGHFYPVPSGVSASTNGFAFYAAPTGTAGFAAATGQQQAESQGEQQYGGVDHHYQIVRRGEHLDHGYFPIVDSNAAPTGTGAGNYAAATGGLYI